MIRRASIAVLVAASIAAPALAEVDVFGRGIPEDPDRPVIVLYANPETRDAALAAMPEFAWRLRAFEPILVVRVDLRTLPRLFKGFADDQLRGDFRRGVERYRELAREEHEAPTADPAASLFFVKDPDGAEATAAGLRDGFREPWVIVYDGAGRELGRGPFPRAAAVLEHAIQSGAAPLTEHR